MALLLSLSPHLCINIKKSIVIFPQCLLTRYEYWEPGNLRTRTSNMCTIGAIHFLTTRSFLWLRKPTVYFVCMTFWRWKKKNNTHYFWPRLCDDFITYSVLMLLSALTFQTLTYWSRTNVGPEAMSSKNHRYWSRGVWLFLKTKNRGSGKNMPSDTTHRCLDTRVLFILCMTYFFLSPPPPLSLSLSLSVCLFHWSRCEWMEVISSDCTVLGCIWVRQHQPCDSSERILIK